MKSVIKSSSTRKFYSKLMGCLCGVMVKELDCGIVVSEFNLKVDD